MLGWNATKPSTKTHVESKIYHNRQKAQLRDRATFRINYSHAMDSLGSLAATVAATYFTYLLLISWNGKIRSAKASRDHGCKPIPTVSSWNPIFCLDTFISIRKADFAGRRSEAYTKIHQIYGQTFLMKPLGVSELQTSHPENIRQFAPHALTILGWVP